MFRIFLLAFIYFNQISCNLLAPNDDPHAIDKYTIDYMSPCRWDTLLNDFKKPDNGTFLTFGQDTQCFIPNAKRDSSAGNSQQDKDNLQTTLEDTLNEAIHVLSDVLDGYCIIYRNGFWTYRYCPGNELVQLHNDSTDPQTLSYTLGRAKPELDRREFQLLYNELGYYVSEIVGMGDVCDVTGAHRLVEVQYVCGETHGIANIQWIRETKICQYEMQISVPELCNLELLSRNEDKKTANHLQCVRYDTQYENNESNIIDLLARYDPIFLGYGLYFLQSLDPYKRDTLMYTQSNLTDGIPKEIFGRFGKAFNRMINQKMLIGPDGNTVVNGDVFTWMSEIFDISGDVISKISIHVTALGKAELQIGNYLIFNEPGNFVSYESKTRNLAHLFGGDVQETNDNEEDQQGDGSSVSTIVKLANNKAIKITATRIDDKKILSLEALNKDANFELLSDDDRQKMLDIILHSDDLQPIIGNLDLEDFFIDAKRYDDTLLFEYTDGTEPEETEEETASTETQTQTVYETRVISDNKKEYIEHDEL
ncbi:Protein OS-9 [Maudiozyma exigua]|uniref:Endoplasmic reticulum lectin n=1 Tax=Maudiozyma exigua TaxID=34358 RepID=A0A9P7BAU3_MAUEX|nr:Protein OS-9 [Kazachstania exigua]